MLPRWGKLRLVDVGHADVQAWVTDLSRTLAPSTVRQIFLVLVGLMKYAIRDGRLSRNPVDGIRLPRVGKKGRGYLSHTQVRDLAAGCGEYGDVVLFLAYTGLRWGEMAALKVGRLDMLRRRLEVAEAVSAPRGQLVWSTPKSHSSRSVPFPSSWPLRWHIDAKAGSATSSFSSARMAASSVAATSAAGSSRPRSQPAKQRTRTSRP